MSTVENQGPNAWSNITNEVIDPKYEKCRNIAEEIYKRINITFQIKKLEAGTQSDLSDVSDQIDSNELSNDTDLFACDKSSLSSSDAERAARGAAACDSYVVNINNNEERLKKPPAVCRRPRKRFRKRIKKAQLRQRARASDGSSDEGPPLSLVAETTRQRADLTKLKSEQQSPEKRPLKRPENASKPTPESKRSVRDGVKPAATENMLPVIPIVPIDFGQKTRRTERTAVDEGLERERGVIACAACTLAFRSERSLRRHVAAVHQAEPASDNRKTEQRDLRLKNDLEITLNVDV